MEAQRDPAGPDLRPFGILWMERTNLRRHARLFVVGLALTAGILCWASGTEERWVKAVLEDTLDAPSSARYVSFDTVAREGQWRMVHVVLDTQNSFGAMLRKSVCVTYRVDNGHYRWLRDEGVQECGKSPSAEEIALIKRLNRWPDVEIASAE